jgi:hypothetical protein
MQRLLFLLVWPGLAACSSAAGGPVDGPADTHCGATVQATDPAVCAEQGTVDVESNPTRYGAESDDDDCKYHVTWSATDVAQNQDVTFTVTLTRKSDGAAAAGAAPAAEVYLDATHPAPVTNQKPTEGPSGTYQIGPVRFDAAGRWTTRFHFYETCTDVAEASPHGHAAFYVEVP